MDKDINWVKIILKLLVVYILIELISIFLSIYLSVYYQVYLFTFIIEIMSFSFMGSRIRLIFELLILMSIPIQLFWCFKRKLTWKYFIVFSLVVLVDMYSLYIAQFASSPNFYDKEIFIDANKRLISLLQ